MSAASGNSKVVLQKTLKASIGCTGIGLHSGKKVAMSLNPAAPDTGIVFHRSDLEGTDRIIPARWDHVVDTRMATTIGNESGACVSTVEHLMAALAGCGIDNAIIEIDGAEVPVMDGSSAPFIFLVECAGMVEQASPRKAIKIEQPIEVGDAEKFVSATPDETFSVAFEIDFEDAAVARQHLSMRLVNGTFKTEIARARTFGFVHEVDALRKAGLALGGSLDNAVVISGDTILNGDGLRYEDEFVRHKILDCVGDLYLAGAPIIGQIDALRSGHALNNQFLISLFANEDAWSYVEMSNAAVPGVSHSWDQESELAIA
ncbi:MAG: UDP-3-O-[3-hydroxymyristoyl] N-acetylglucosamine deacetylase [Rhodospirillaceae bacterium]|nr:UDP-3-O-[3-hydroxymyristoyl] N-acetylglucosamine deacetylase [Rhodospirillaceae bacterium]